MAIPGKRPENALEDAIRAYQSGLYPSIRATARAFNVPPSTLKDRLNGRENKRASHRQQQRLTETHELFLIQCCKASWWVPSHDSLRWSATALLRANGDTAPLGKNWVKRFIARHPEVIDYLGSPTDPRSTEKEIMEQLQKGQPVYL